MVKAETREDMRGQRCYEEDKDTRGERCEGTQTRQEISKDERQTFKPVFSSLLIIIIFQSNLNLYSNYKIGI